MGSGLPDPSPPGAATGHHWPGNVQSLLGVLAGVARESQAWPGAPSGAVTPTCVPRPSTITSLPLPLADLCEAVAGARVPQGCRISWGARDKWEGLALVGLHPPPCERGLNIVRALLALGKLVSSKLSSIWLPPLSSTFWTPPTLTPKQTPGKLARRGAGTPGGGRPPQPCPGTSVLASQLLGRRKASRLCR